jgi:hypothetical protein
MSISDRYLAYADAFELSLADDDWTRLEQYFTEDAVYRPDGTPDSDVTGRDAVLARLKGGVDQFDRRMDSREIRFTAEPQTDGDRVSVRWQVKYTKAGKPDVEIFGTETATFQGDRICLLSDEFDADAQAAIESWIKEHGPSLAG